MNDFRKPLVPFQQPASSFHGYLTANRRANPQVQPSPLTYGSALALGSTVVRPAEHK